MSVAFRRESDEEHLEPRFEIPIPPGPNLVTPRGLALIGERVKALETEIAALAAQADTERVDKEQAMVAMKRDLRYWHTRQTTAELAPPPSGDTVEIGTTVTFRLNGAERSLTVVGDDEADPANGLVAFSAPLARALMHAEEGEWLSFNGRDDAVEIVSISVTSQ